MSWYKQAQHPNVYVGSFVSHDSDEIDTELDVFINGEKRTYYGMNSEDAKKIRWMANTKHLPGGIILNKLKPFSNPKMYKKLNPPKPDTEEEKQQMLSELPSQKELWGWE